MDERADYADPPSLRRPLPDGLITALRVVSTIAVVALGLLAVLVFVLLERWGG